jgi:N-acetyl-anhydromuramyl-L-alanine amidase AmpD
MNTLRKGDSGPDVVTLQKELTADGFALVADGQFGSTTETKVKQFQSSKGLTADGIVGNATWSALLGDSGKTPFSAVVDRYMALNAGQYVEGSIKHTGICLHHTVSSGSADKVINGWNADSRGAVGTHFVIGGVDANGDATHDGEIVQCIDLGDWAYHVATTRMGKTSSHNENANKLYVGIEVCSFGCLTLKDGKYYTMDGANREVPASQVEVLDQDWRTYKYWHKYTPKQVDAIVRLIVELDRVLGLRIADSPYDSIATLFDLSWDALFFRRKLTTHSSFEDGKYDAYPCKELLTALRQHYR